MFGKVSSLAIANGGRRMEFTIEIELTSILFRTAAIDPADPNRCPAVTYNAAQRLPCLVAPGNRFHRSNCLAHLSRTMSYLSVMLHKLTARCQHFRNLSTVWKHSVERKK